MADPDLRHRCDDATPPQQLGPLHQRRPTQKQRREATERRLLDAALALIAESGSRSISTAQVGATAGYSRGIVTHQFGSKRELLRRAVQHAQEQVGISPTATGLQWILELVDAYLDSAAEPATRAFLLMWGEAVANDDNVRDIYIDRDHWFRELICTAVTDAVAQGTVRRDVDPEAFAYLVIGLLRGTTLQLVLAPNPDVQQSVKRECAELVRRHLATTAPSS